MSLILDALRRAERERQSAPVTVLVDRGLPAPRNPSSHWPRSAGIMLLIVGVAALTFWLLRGERPATGPAVLEVPAPAPVVAAAPATPALPATPVEPDPEPIRGTETAASLDDLAVEPLEPELATPPVRRRPTTPVHPQAQTRAAQAPVEDPPPTVAAETLPVEEPAPEPEPESAAEPPAVSPALTQPAPLRRLREMPPEYRAAFPQLNVEVHFYEREPARRFVRINQRRYKEGERLSEGPVIAEIVRDGIVFDFRGEKVLYPLGR
jgi:general secretion pathway protein B